MPVLVDFSQVCIANLMVQLGNHQNAEVDENALRHMILNTIRFNRKKFFNQYGELIICTDAKNSWRKEIYPYYKAKRRKNREESELDWPAIFKALGNIQQELDEVFPYKVISVDGAEADDIIGTVCHTEGTILNSGKPILILSGDKDYIQLHKYGNISQYDPVRKRDMKRDDPEQFLKEHIIRGDSGDGVPNILSPDNTFVLGVRQKTLTEKRMKKFLNGEDIEGEVARNFNRNEMMIDLNFTPDNIKTEILNKYHEPNEKNRSKLFNFFVQKRLNLLLDHITEF